MPELPEVEVITRALRDGGRGCPAILGCTIEAVELLDRRILVQDHPSDLARLNGAQVLDVQRRAKYIILVTTAARWWFHLRMTGDLQVMPEGESPHALRLRMHLRCDPSSGRDAMTHQDAPRHAHHLQLCFIDPRRLGQIGVIDAEKDLFGHLGPEAFPESLPDEWWHQTLSASGRQLKAMLLDQTVVAGLGNIWVDEVLFCAGLHPARRACTLQAAERQRLSTAMHAVLSEAIAATEKELRWMHQGNGHRPPGRVHRRAGEPCPRCGCTLQKIRVAGRGTYVCSHCQPAPGAGAAS